jgi:hypothetical protein
MIQDTQDVHLVVHKVLGMDLLGVNRQVTNFLEISTDIKLFYQSTNMKLLNLRGVNYANAH